MSDGLATGDKVRLRKPHPCGGYIWEVTRLGVDIGLVCQTCHRRILLPRSEFNKRLKHILRPALPPDATSSPPSP